MLWTGVVIFLLASAWAQEDYEDYEYPVVHIRAESDHYQFTWSDAWHQCNSRGLTLATPAQLQEAWSHGYDKCACGWLADGSVGYPIRTPRTGCGSGDAGIRSCPNDPASWSKSGWDVYCSTKKVPISHFKSPSGHYKLTWDAAKQTCEDNNMVLATKSQLQQAREDGYDRCACGWLADGTVYYPINNPRSGCGNDAAGLRNCPVQPWNGVGWDVYCYNGHLPVVHFKSASGHYKYSWDQAKELCLSHGMNMATPTQLQDAFDLGMDMCACGWMADGSVKYPIQNPRNGCGNDAPGLRTCSSDPASWGQAGYDVYCSTVQVPVTHIMSSAGHYKLTWEAAKQECHSRGLPMASVSALMAAQEMGYDMCACGWLADGSVHYPITKPRTGCGSGPAAIRTCSNDPSDWNMDGWDVYCGVEQVPVVRLQAEEGHYKLTQEDASLACAQGGMAVATQSELLLAQTMGYDECACGWLSDGTVRYPINNPRTGCGSDPPGIRTCPTNSAEWSVPGWDVYCSTLRKVPIPPPDELEEYTVPEGYAQIGVVGEDCPGNDITHYDVSLAECFQKCDELSACVGIVYSTDPTAADKCWPKHTMCTQTTTRVRTAVFAREIPDPLTDFTVPDGYEQIGEVGEDCPGNDITHFDVSLEQCFIKCDEQSACVGIVYSTDPTAADKCWPKNRLCDPTSPRVQTAVFKRDVPDPFSDFTVPEGYEQIETVGHDCPGNDITHYDVSLDVCFEKCDEEPVCVGIVYSTDPTAADKCWLKHLMCEVTSPRVHTAVYAQIVPDPPAPTADPSIPPQGFETVGGYGKDSPGNDIEVDDSAYLEVDVCAVLCKNTTGCVGIVYMTDPLPTEKMCNLKSNLVDPVAKENSAIFRKIDDAQKQWQVRLADGTNECNGRVETHDGEKWGTVCAKGININGWVWVVCKDLGCGKAVDKGFCGKHDCTVPDDYHLALRGPKCSGNKFDEFHMCDFTKEIDCDHQKDVWVQCEFDAPQVTVEI